MEAVPAHTEMAPPPAHVAIIMDGNGRWAQRHGLARTAGHRRGVESVRNVIQSAVELGISYLTVYGFSSENWKRPESEVLDLMSLLRVYLRSEIAELHKKGVRIRFIGERDRLDRDIIALMEAAEERTRFNTRLTFAVALSYGGRNEITGAARQLALEVAAGRLKPEDITEASVSERLYTAGIPDPDLIIRTSGEQRLSNFLLWQSAYTEFVFTDTLWPDFGKKELEQAISDFRGRERRYGATSG